MDYKKLNAVTMKSKFPMPIVDELLDELAGTRWFCKSDLRVGYHYIRMVPKDEHKKLLKYIVGHFSLESRILVLQMHHQHFCA